MSTHPRYIRPRLHVTVPYWLNDPCAPTYDPKTGLYHLLYQCNPFSTTWGNTSWGHVTSRDLLHWTFMPNQPALAPDRIYDKDGVFTGGMFPVTKDGKLRAIYSSITKLPFAWHTPPYPRNCAGLAMAISADGGKTWTKSNKNPIIEGEPEGIEVSGYRDPYIAPWEQLDLLRGSSEHWYGLVSGGIDAKGPTSFLYAVHPDKPEEWKYLGPLVDMPLRWNPSAKWSGNFGVNWECVNFMTLTSNSRDLSGSAVTRDFLIIGAEGDTERPDVKTHKLPGHLSPRTVRTQVWMQGDLVRSSSGQVRMKHRYSGLFDHGPYYAANSFVDPKTSRRIVHGWIPEEDTTAKHAERKVWNGALALPREVFVQTTSNVVRALQTPLQEITSIEIDRDSSQPSDVSTIRTMGQRPIVELERLRTNAIKINNISSFGLGASAVTTKHVANTTNPTWELEAVVQTSRACRRVGFHLRHSADMAISTILTFDLSQEQITLDRSNSVTDPALLHNVNTCPDSGPFTLFTCRNPVSRTEEMEKLHIRIFSDGDTLELFVNERFAIGTVVYTGEYESCGGITTFAESAGSLGDSKPCATFESLKVWDGLNGGKSLISGWEHVGLKRPDRIDASRL